MSVWKRFFLIYILIFIGGLITGWFIVSLDEYLKWAKSFSHPTFWQVFKPF